MTISNGVEQSLLIETVQNSFIGLNSIKFTYQSELLKLQVTKFNSKGLTQEWKRNISHVLNVQRWRCQA